ncbi:MAG: lipopolysaccharide biosynthesis protein, partial [Frankiales bacterium]|nr:lipopolysaccharide biosynthesis protein [Frankiales bacterium]
RYRKLYVSAMRGLSYLTVPLVAFFAVMAEEVIRVVLGDQWTGAADVFRLLAIGGMFQVIGYNNGWLYVSSGNTARMARWALFSRPTVVIGFLVGLPWGIAGVAAGFAVTQVLLAPIGFWSATRDNPVCMRDIGAAVWRSYVLAGVMAALVLPLRLGLDDRSPFLSLGVCLLAAAVIMAAGILLWPGARRELFELLAMARKSPPRRPVPGRRDTDLRDAPRSVPAGAAQREEGSS